LAGAHDRHHSGVGRRVLVRPDVCWSAARTSSHVKERAIRTYTDAGHRASKGRVCAGLAGYGAAAAETGRERGRRDHIGMSWSVCLPAHAACFARSRLLRGWLSRAQSIVVHARRLRSSLFTRLHLSFAVTPHSHSHTHSPTPLHAVHRSLAQHPWVLRPANTSGRPRDQANHRLTTRKNDAFRDHMSADLSTTLPSHRPRLVSALTPASSVCNKSLVRLSACTLSSCIFLDLTLISP